MKDPSKVGEVKEAPSPGSVTAAACEKLTIPEQRSSSRVSTFKHEWSMS